MFPEIVGAIKDSYEKPEEGYQYVIAFFIGLSAIAFFLSVTLIVYDKKY